MAIAIEEVLFFSNGNTAVIGDGAQVPELQKPWLLIFVQTLIDRGIDPIGVKFILPSGRTAKIFKIEHGYNWEVL